MTIPVPPVSEEIGGPQAWRRDTLSPDSWLVPMPGPAIAELDAVTRSLRRAPRPWHSLGPADFELGACVRVMAEVRDRLARGAGLAVLDRVPVERYHPDDNRAIGWLLASLLGQIAAQKWDGTRLYDVKDSGQALGYGVRRSVTNLGQPFHTDGPWLWQPPRFVGLLCLQSAPEGGLSRFASLVTAHDELLRHHPGALERLYRPFRWDRQAEHGPDDPRFATHPVFARDGRSLTARYYDDYIANGSRLAGEVLDAEGIDALAGMRAIVEAPEYWIEFPVQQGQFQYIDNRRLAHSRTEFRDAPGAGIHRHMLRFWNRDEGTPHLEGPGPPDSTRRVPATACSEPGRQTRIRSLRTISSSRVERTLSDTRDS
jgi:alpha-ketoglutarate-dependent taurine dioxygenase